VAPTRPPSRQIHRSAAHRCMKRQLGLTVNSALTKRSCPHQAKLARWSSSPSPLRCSPGRDVR
jgi:hypothetical protein